MSRIGRSLACALAGVVAVSQTGWAASPLAGAWAGEQFRLLIDAKGGRFETSCASGALSAISAVAADGRFTATGTFEKTNTGSGPQRVEETGKPAVPAPARFAGRVEHEHMTLSIWADGAQDAQVFDLQRGARAKLIRCL